MNYFTIENWLLLCERVENGKRAHLGPYIGFYHPLSPVTASRHLKHDLRGHSDQSIPKSALTNCTMLSKLHNLNNPLLNVHVSSMGKPKSFDPDLWGLFNACAIFKTPNAAFKSLPPQVQENSDQRTKRPESGVLGFGNFVGFMVENIVRKRIVHRFRLLRILSTG